MRPVYWPPLVAPCPVCGYSIKVEKGGKLRQHGRRGGCPAAVRPPAKHAASSPPGTTRAPRLCHRSRVQPQEALTGSVNTDL